MDLIIIPFHDWRKSEKEGFRTRDAHFIKSLSNHSEVDKILVINRPVSWVELTHKRIKRELKGKLLFNKKKFALTQVGKNVFVVDYFARDVISLIIKKHIWFIDKYADAEYLLFIKESCRYLKIKDFTLVVQNVFSYKLVEKIDGKLKVFDAWDNFLKFPSYTEIRTEVLDAYINLAKSSKKWVTNSEENRLFFNKRYKPQDIIVIKNGVEQSFVTNKKPLPEDLKSIPQPIIGFGGKISYLLDVDLINFITLDNENLSFVFVGQILDKTIFNDIVKRENVYFLGDKHYKIYSIYVQHFDIGIVPYKIKEDQHGGDSIKAYEYLAANKKVVGTRGNGLLELSDHVYLANNAKEFSKHLKTLENNKSELNILMHSWSTKTNDLIKYIRSGNN